MPVALAVLIIVAIAIAAAIGLWLWRRRRAVRKLPLPGIYPVPHIQPVVLVHGVLGFDHMALMGQRIVYFRGVADMLRDVGVEVYTVRLPTMASVPGRAHALAEFVRALPCRRVNLVAHSMGGLDARFAISRCGLDESVASLVTVASPHRGTPLADLLAGTVGILPVRALRSVVGFAGLDTGAVDWLTTRRAGEINRTIGDADGVLYGCVIGRAQRRLIRANPVLLSSHTYILARAGDNDGMVPAASQYWGETFDEVDADHWAQIGWSSYFDANRMYLRVIEQLRRRGL